MPVPQAADAAQPRIVVLIPARDEEACIEETLDSIFRQSAAPDRVIVIADNCTDATVDLARARRAEVLETVGNRDRKAGALNQAWRHVADDLNDHDALVIVDADTLLDRRFCENAFAHLARSQRLAAVGGSFTGRFLDASAPGRFLALLQRMEYARYHRAIARNKGVTGCLSGAGTMFAVGRLRELETKRGYVWDSTAIIEDFEITLALRHLGYRILSPKNCIIHTDVMASVGQLWHQRIRWQRGTLNELRKYGVSRTTAVDYAKQIGLGFAVAARLFLLVGLVLTLLMYGGIRFDPVWSGLAAILAFERTLTIRRLGLSAMLVSSLLVIEMTYDVFRECFFARSAWLHFRRAEWRWHAT